MKNTGTILIIIGVIGIIIGLIFGLTEILGTLFFILGIVLALVGVVLTFSTNKEDVLAQQEPAEKAEKFPDMPEENLEDKEE